jgi:hypothetical protein
MYHFRLQRTDGSPVDPPHYRSSTLNWRQGDKIPLTASRGRYALDELAPGVRNGVFRLMEPPCRVLPWSSPR